jgi:hypothetical protein
MVLDIFLSNVTKLNWCICECQPLKLSLKLAWLICFTLNLKKNSKIQADYGHLGVFTSEDAFIEVIRNGSGLDPGDVRLLEVRPCQEAGISKAGCPVPKEVKLPKTER